MAITKILNLQEADKRNPAAHLKNAIEYIQNPDKTEKCVLVGSLNCLPDSAFEQMMETKELYQKTGKRQGYHVIISFSPEEYVEPEQAMYVVENFAKELLGEDYEAVYAVHTDRKHVHGHLIWNSVSLTTGKKYNSPKGNWKHHLQPITNKYCGKLGLNIMPAEYSEYPKNLPREDWEKEMSFRDIILRDAKMCMFGAGDVEHFEYLMRSLGYNLKKGSWLEVQVPGCKYFHKLEKLDSIFEKENLSGYLDMPGLARPFFYTGDVRELKQTNMSGFQEWYYAKIYHLRVVEQNRFTMKSAKYAEDLKQLHLWQDKYWMLINNNIQSLDDLAAYYVRHIRKVEQLETQQREMHRERQKRKRQIKTEEDLLEYQAWHLETQRKLEKIKEEKKEAKHQVLLARNAMCDNVDYSILDKYEKEPFVENEDVVFPWTKRILENKKRREEKRRNKENEKTGTLQQMVEDVLEKSGKFVSEENNEKQKVVEKEDESKMADVDGESVGAITGKDEERELEGEISEETILQTAWSNVRGKEYDETSGIDKTEALYDKPHTEMVWEEDVESKGENREVEVLENYKSYCSNNLERRALLMDVSQGMDLTNAINKVKEGYLLMGHEADFDEIYEEAKELLDYVNSLETKDKLERIVEKLVAYGTYETIPLSVKADILAFDLADASGNLKLFMSVLKQLGVKMEQDEMFEEYQKIYTETVERAGREERSEVWRGKER